MEDLKGKFKQLVTGFKEKECEENQNSMELERMFEKLNLAPEEDSMSFPANIIENYF